MGFPLPSFNVVFDYFSHSFLKMCKIDVKRTLDATFLDCLALMFCDIIGGLLPQRACLTLQGGTTFRLTSNMADIPVSRVRTPFLMFHITDMIIQNNLFPSLSKCTRQIFKVDNRQTDQRKDTEMVKINM